MTATVVELQRAWRAVQAGRFRDPGDVQAPADAVAAPIWCPEPGEQVLPVVGAQHGIGTTLMALALATVSAPARVVECAGIAVGGLAVAPTAELGERGGWVQGRRRDVIVDRLRDEPRDTAEVAFPPLLDRLSRLTVVDMARAPLGLLTSSTWLGYLIRDSESVVVVGVATVPGLRRLETTVAGLGPERCVAGVIGPPRPRWSRCLVPGPVTRDLVKNGRVVAVPMISALRLVGADSSDELPTPLLAAARRALAATHVGSSGGGLS
jgi:hypothetical protein